MIKYIIAFLISTIIFVQTLKDSGNCMFNPSGCRNSITTMQNGFKIVNLETEAINRLYSQYCILKEYKAKIWLCKGIETNTNRILNLLKLFFTQANFLEIRNNLFNNIQVYNCKVLIGRDIVVFVLEGIFSNDDPNKAISYLNENKHKTQTNKIESWFMAVTVLEFNGTYSIGRQRKLRKCRLGPLLHNVEKRNVGNIDDNANLSFVYLLDDSDILHYTTKATETLQQYGPKKEQLYRIKIFNNKIEKIIAENGHLVLNCTEIALVSKVQWYKNNELLNSSLRHNIAEAENEPHLTIDAYNSLYILQATKEEEGIYTCFINGRQVQTYFVKVVSKSKLLNQEFLKYSIYLGFVLSLTITCYCAGICVAWHQRNSFADPLYLNLNKR